MIPTRLTHDEAGQGGRIQAGSPAVRFFEGVSRALHVSVRRSGASGVLARALAVLALSMFAQAAAQTANQGWFEHAQHVWSGWNERTEVERDCRGCHQYSKDGKGEDLPRPADLCANCHAPDGFTALEPTFDTSGARVRSSSERGARFKHGSHLDMKCATCHFAANGDTFKIPPPSAATASIADCVRCHQDEHRDKFNAGITKLAEGSRAEQNPFPIFRHDAHMTPDELADPASCLRCHASVVTARPDSLAEQQFDTKRCSECHVGMEFSAVENGADGAKVQKKSSTAGIFDHEPHLRGGVHGPNSKATSNAFAEIADQGCLACHAWDREAAGGSNFALGPRFQVADTHDACATCHQEWRAPNHGNTGQCAKCHAIQPGAMLSLAKLKSNRPTETIERFDPVSFKFETQSHVLIHGQASADSRACSECHRATMDRQPSRIGVQPFRHSTHVPPGDTSSETCMKCHFVGNVPTSLADARFPKSTHAGASVSVSYDPASCVPCHGEGAGIPTFSPTPRTSTLAFDHRAHLNRPRPWDKSKMLECSDCHITSAAGAAVEITLQDKVMDCTLCHGHDVDPRKAPPSGTRETIDGCIQCHRVGVPAKGQDVIVGRSALRLDLDSYQEHSGSKECASCHRVPDPPRATREVGERVVGRIAMQKSERTPNPHRVRTVWNQGKSFEQQIEINFWDQATCFDCHWHDMTKQLGDSTWKQRDEKTKNVAAHLRQVATSKFDGYGFRELFGKLLGAQYPGSFPGISRRPE